MLEMDCMSDAQMSTVQTAGSNDESIDITSMICLMISDVMLCGLVDGTVALYDISKGRKMRDIYHHYSGHWVSDTA